MDNRTGRHARLCRIGRLAAAAAIVSVAVLDTACAATGGANQFLPAVHYPTAANPFGVVVADVNQDGIPDLVVANAEQTAEKSAFSVLLGNGDGTFQAARNFASGGGEATSIAVGDFNGDGKPDLVIANFGSGDGTDNVTLLAGVGDGTFHEPVVIYSNGDKPDFVAAADLNGDGKLDLVITTSSNGVVVLISKGNGSFKEPRSYSTGFYAAGVVIADLNKDGRLDLAVANENSDDLSVLLGNGDGTFHDAVNFAAGPGPASIAAGDFNGDGHLDLVVANAGSATGTTVSVLLGKGNGSFAPFVKYRAGDEPFSVAVGDFNHDGKLDLVVSDAGTTKGNTLELLLGNGDGTFKAAAPYTVGEGAVAVTTGDLNHDGYLDAIVANDASSDVSVLLNVGNACTKNPPITGAVTNPSKIWPADNRLVDVTVTYNAVSQCGGSVPSCRLNVSSNEPSEQQDWQIIDLHHLTLRADMLNADRYHPVSRPPYHHVYTVTIQCTDSRNNVARQNVYVTVAP